MADKPSADDVKALFALHYGSEAKSERLLRSYGFDSTRGWIDPNGKRLSDRIWDARNATRSQIDEILRRAVASGTDALEVAKILEQYLQPEFAPIRNAGGRLIRNQAKSIVTVWPGRGGHGSTAARRLTRTEISRAHASATLLSTAKTPFSIGVKWLLSNRHPKSDPCNINATRDSGLGPGVYRVDDAPRMPEHPNCLCVYAPVVEEDDDKIIAELKKEFGL